MAQVHVMTGVERRRRWSQDQKRAVVAAAFAPGASVADVARRADLCPGQIYRWRQDLGAAAPGFARVVVAAPEPHPPEEAMPALEVAFGDSVRVRIPAAIPPDLAAAVIKALVPR
jgi:transposase